MSEKLDFIVKFVRQIIVSIVTILQLFVGTSIAL